MDFLLCIVVVTLVAASPKIGPMSSMAALHLAFMLACLLSHISVAQSTSAPAPAAASDSNMFVIIIAVVVVVLMSTVFIAYIWHLRARHAALTAIYEGKTTTDGRK